MTKIVKPDLTYQWASAAGGGSVAPSSGKIQTGHIVVDTQVYAEWQRAIDFSSQNYGMIIGASPPDGGLTGFIDNFVVRKSA